MSSHIQNARFIVGMRVDATSYSDASDQAIEWARRGESRYVCIASVNNVMQSHDHPSFRDVMNEADLVTPDGMPLAWGLRRLGIPAARRVYGPDLMSRLLTDAEKAAIPVAFYGGSPEALADLERHIARTWPAIKVAYSWSPPFRPLRADEDRHVVDQINASGARILFVGLGCPKQEVWMAQHAGRVRAVMVGVGAAFDFLAGRKKQAPAIMQRISMEWLFRLITEPRRLWKRYLKNNPRFMILFGLQLLRSPRDRRSSM